MSQTIDIRKYIPIGRENAITRTQLVIQTGLSDRKVRKLIEEQRKTLPVINVGSGYFLPTKADIPYIQAYINREKNKALHILGGLKQTKAILDDYQKERI